jgi:hypothetical protein
LLTSQVYAPARSDRTRRALSFRFGAIGQCAAIFVRRLQMKTVLILCGGVLCLSTWQAYAQESNTTTSVSSAATPETVINSEGPGISSVSMSGGGATMSHGKTRAQVYQDLVHSQQDGEAARLQELFKGGN